MNLEEFIDTSLRQIISGVKKAQLATAKSNKHPTEADMVNPAIMYSGDSAPKGQYYATVERNLVHFVDFDVAVTADSSSEAKAGLSLKVAGIGLGGGASTTGKDTVVSRVKFQIPIELPKSVHDIKPGE